MKSKTDLASTLKLMGTLARMKPKPHEDMKVGKSKRKKKKSPARRKAKGPGLGLPDDAVAMPQWGNAGLKIGHEGKRKHSKSRAK